MIRVCHIIVILILHEIGIILFRHLYKIKDVRVILKTTNHDTYERIFSSGSCSVGHTGRWGNKWDRSPRSFFKNIYIIYILLYILLLTLLINYLFFLTQYMSTAVAKICFLTMRHQSSVTRRIYNTFINLSIYNSSVVNHLILIT